VFEQNLAALQRAFQEAGLEAGGVEISLADSGGQPEPGDGRTGRRRIREAADRFGLIVPEANLIDERHDLVDVTV
jgi:hypothetical protein